MRTVRPSRRVIPFHRSSDSHGRKFLGRESPPVSATVTSGPRPRVSNLSPCGPGGPSRGRNAESLRSLLPTTSLVPYLLRPLPRPVILHPMNDVTHILNAIEQGDPSAAEQLLLLVYDELRPGWGSG